MDWHRDLRGQREEPKIEQKKRAGKKRTAKQGREHVDLPKRTSEGPAKASAAPPKEPNSVSDLAPSRAGFDRRDDRGPAAIAGPARSESDWAYAAGVVGDREVRGLLAMRDLSRARERAMARLASSTGDATGGEFQPYWGISTTQASATMGSLRFSFAATRSSWCAPTVPTASFMIMKLRTRSESIHCSSTSSRCPAGGCRRSGSRGTAADAKRRAALVSFSIRARSITVRRSVALDRHRSDLELHVRGLPFDQRAQELRSAKRARMRPPTAEINVACEACHGPDRIICSGRRSRTIGKGSAATTV